MATTKRITSSHDFSNVGGPSISWIVAKHLDRLTSAGVDISQDTAITITSTKTNPNGGRMVTIETIGSME